MTAENPTQTTCPYPLATDPTAQTGPLTEGQKIVADWEMNPIGEPCDLARVIDLALAEAWEKGAGYGRRCWGGGGERPPHAAANAR